MGIASWARMPPRISDMAADCPPPAEPMNDGSLAAGRYRDRAGPGAGAAWGAGPSSEGQAGGVATAGAHHATSRMRTGTAQPQAIDRRPVAGPTRNRTHEGEAIERHRAVEDVAAAEAEEAAAGEAEEKSAADAKDESAADAKDESAADAKAAAEKTSETDAGEAATESSDEKPEAEAAEESTAKAKSA